MVYQAPSGARDLLPLDVAQKHWIEDRLEQIFQRWGYHRIITSTVEQLDTLMAGGAIDQDAVIELHQGTGQRLGLRPELTASIARTAVTRLSRVTYPQRLYYTANVFRQTHKGIYGSQQEFYQSGVELIGSETVTADAEILLLLVDSLDNLSLPRWSLVLGDAHLTRCLLEPFPDSVRDKVRQALAQLDRIALEHLEVSSELKDHALRLFDLRGKPEMVLQAVSGLKLSLEAQTTVTRLKTLIALLRESGRFQPGEDDPERVPGLVLDLSLIQTFDYYTGLVFEVVTSPHMGCQVLGQGGRYDNLLGVFHHQGKSFPGIGFVLHTEAIHQALLPSGLLPQETPSSDWLVVPRTEGAAAAAFAYAQTLRSSANLVRAEVHLDPTTPAKTLRQMAQQRNIHRIAWIDENGLPEIESLN
jgi:ATP phosphoribosyltransferase regulatory subunit